jgi:hypothetical protein
MIGGRVLAQQQQVEEENLINKLLLKVEELDQKVEGILNQTQGNYALIM